LIPLVEKMGFDPTTDFTVNMALAYGTFINIAVKKLHDRFDLPDWVLVEQRTPDANHYVSFEQPGQKVIHRALKVYQRDPRVTLPQCDVPFRLDSNGVHVGYDHGTTVWLRYMQPAPQYAGVAWGSSATYKVGDMVIDTGGTAESYVSLLASNLNHQPSTNPTWWSLTPFPESAADLVIRYAFAEALREDGQFDKAASEEQAVLSDAVTKVAAMINLAFDPISDQARPPGRYRLPLSLSGGK
jgi:hypothetical protein